jgi:transposase
MRKGNTKSGNGKQVVVAAGDRVFVGLDVHKKSYHAAVRVNGVEVRTSVLAPRSEAVLIFLAPYRSGRLHVVYEAGPTGFGLARALRQAKVPTDVIAPSKTPRAPGQENKTDRLDCRELAFYHEKGMLRQVAVPTEEQEQDRQLIRLRDQVVDARRRVKQQIKSFLLQHGQAEPAGLAHWSKGSVQALRDMVLPATLRFCLDVMVMDLAHLDQQLGQVNNAIENLSREPRHASMTARLCKHPGVGVITAMQYRTELFRPERFANQRQVAAYLGLAPRVSQSGERHRTGPLLKAGRGRLRALLVEAAWRWIQVDDDARVIYRRLVQNTGQPNKAITGMARRLAIRLWRELVPPEEQDRAG